MPWGTPVLSCLRAGPELGLPRYTQPPFHFPLGTSHPPQGLSSCLPLTSLLPGNATEAAGVWPAPAWLQESLAVPAQQHSRAVGTFKVDCTGWFFEVQ